MGTLPGSPLGKATVYADRYDPALLYAVERAPQRVGGRAEIDGNVKRAQHGRQPLGELRRNMIDEEGGGPAQAGTALAFTQERTIEDGRVRRHLLALKHE